MAAFRWSVSVQGRNLCRSEVIRPVSSWSSSVGHLGDEDEMGLVIFPGEVEGLVHRSCLCMKLVHIHTDDVGRRNFPLLHLWFRSWRLAWEYGHWRNCTAIRGPAIHPGGHR